MIPLLTLILTGLCFQVPASAGVVAYPHINAPHGMAGMAVSASVQLGIKSNLVSLSIPRYTFSTLPEKIDLQFHGQPPAAYRQNGQRQVVLIRGEDSFAILPKNPKRGDTAVIIPIFSEFAKYPAKTEVLTAKTLKELESALAKVSKNVTANSLSRVSEILNRQFDGTDTALLSALKDMNPDNFVIDGIETRTARRQGDEISDDAVHLSEKGLYNKRHEISLYLLPSKKTTSGRRSSSIEIATMHDGTRGWTEQTTRLTPSNVRNPELRRAANVLHSALTTALARRPKWSEGDGPQQRMVNRILRRLRRFMTPA